MGIDTFFQSVRSSTWFRWGLKTLFGLSLMIWATAPLVVLRLLAEDSPITITSWQIWMWVAMIWAGAFIVVSTFMLHHVVQKKEASQITQCLLGLICTLTLGVPALLLGALPIVAENIGSLQQLYPQGAKLDISGSVAETAGVAADTADGPPPKPVEYVIALDVSRSFLNPSDKARKEEVAKVLTGLFGAGGVVGDALGEGACVTIYAFAGAPKVVAKNWDGDGKCRRRSREAVIAGLRDSLSAGPETMANLSRDEYARTDLLDLLDAVYEDLTERQDRRSAVRLVVLSDFLHSPGEADQKASDQLDQEVGSLAKRFARLPDVALVGFHGASQLPAGTGPAERGTDLRGLLQRHLREKWQSVEIAEFLQAPTPTRFLLPTNLYQHVVTWPVLHLKYYKVPSYSFIPSELKVPDGDDTDNVYLGLWSEAVVDPAESAESMRLKFEPGSKDELVLDQKGKCQFWQRRESSSNPVRIEMDNHPKDDDIAHYLLIAIPKKSLLYKIRLVCLEVQHNDGLTALRRVLMILNFLPVVLAYFMWKSEAKDFASLGRTEAAGGAAG